MSINALFMHCFSNICILMHVHSILLLPIILYTYESQGVGRN